jgi:hypothetical protein
MSAPLTLGVGFVGEAALGFPDGAALGVGFVGDAGHDEGNTY